MSRVSGALRLGLCIAGASVLSACGIFGGQVNMEIPEVLKQKCPPVGIVAFTGEISRFSGVGRGTADLIDRAQISGLQVQCSDSEDETGLYATITFDVSATRGAAATGSTAEFPFFVTVTRGNEAVLEKQLYTSAHRFGSQARSAQRERINAYVPLSQTGQILDLEILVGFQLSREQLGYNIAR